MTIPSPPQPETSHPREDAFEEYGSSAARFRRNLILTAVIAVVAVVAVSAGLAVRQYRHAQHASLRDLGSRAIVAASVVNASFAGDVSTLQAVAASPAFTNLETSRMSVYLRRIDREDGNLFNGGMAWVDTRGLVRVSTSALAGGAAPSNVRDRAYFRYVLANGRPFVSGGLIGRRLGEPVVAVAVPTTSADGQVSGVLVGAVRLASVNTKRAALDLGYTGLEIVDRNGRRLLSGLTPVRNAPLLARMSRHGSGVVAGTHGLGGTGNDVVAFATAAVPDWRIVIDRPRSDVDAAALHSFALQLLSVGAVALVVFATVAFVVLRSRRDHRRQEVRARAWAALTVSLAAAGTPEEVTAAVTTSLQEVFPDAMVVVVVDGIDGTRETTVANPLSWRRVTGNRRAMDEIATLAVSRRQSVALDGSLELRAVLDASGGRLHRLHSLSMLDGGRETIGGIAILRGSAAALEPTEWALFDSIVLQAGQAFERSRRSAHDRRIALRLQRSLLPEALPDVAGVALAGHYRAGSEGLEVGGDWYDAVRRDDGVLLLCVGDVIGRGVAAAMLMGRLRDAFRAHAYESSSPAEIVRRMRQHVMDKDMMITLACVALDPYAGLMTYSCAGHPPPLLIAEAGETTRLEGAASPPLGVADAASISEAVRTVVGPATLVLYSDGLVERRGQSIDLGIDVLGEVVASDPGGPIDETIAKVNGALGAGDDDVALLVVRITGEPVAFDVELPADAAGLSTLRSRLQAWLARVSGGADADAIVLAVSEACNNAIEHGYRSDIGSIWIRVDTDGDTLRATVRDHGRWSEEPSGEDRGRGIAIMEALTDTCAVERTPEGTTVVLEWRRHAPTDAVRA